MDNSVSPRLYHCAVLYSKMHHEQFKQDAADIGGSMCIKERIANMQKHYIREQKYKKELNKNVCGVYTPQQLTEAAPHLWRPADQVNF